VYRDDTRIEPLPSANYLSLSNPRNFCALHKRHIAMHNERSYLRPMQGTLHLA
jgi:hypothetical protein